MYLDKKKYKTQRAAIMKAQAHVLARQQRRAFLKLKQDNSLAKQYIMRYLAMQWYKRIRNKNNELNQALLTINDTIGQYNQQAEQFQKEFRYNGMNEPPKTLDHMTDFEGMQRRAYVASNGQIPSHIPGLLG